MMLAIFSSLLLLLASAAVAAGDELQMPQLDLEPGQWIIIESEQKTQAANAVEPQNSWRVKDIYSLDEDISYSLHTNQETGKSYVLLASEGRVFHTHEDDNTCQGDHRQDHSTLFPWRSQFKLSKRETVERTLIGLGAVWFNSRGRARCETIIQVGSVQCKWDHEASKSKVNLIFGPATGVREFERLLKVQVEHSHAIHALKSANNLLSIVVRAEVKSVKIVSNLPDKLYEQVRLMKENCLQSTSRQHSFPSLMKEILQSQERYYQFEYTLNYYRPPHGRDEFNARQSISSKYDIQEEFSYTRALQRITNKDKKELLHRLFEYQYGEKGKVGQQVCFTKPTTTGGDCRLSLFEDPLEKLSPVLSRQLLFSRGEAEKQELFAGSLVGLGALLMNAADLQDKRESPTIETTPDGSVKIISWLIEDQENDLTFTFKFDLDHPSQNSRQDIGMKHLLAVEVRKVVDLSQQDGQVVDYKPKELGGLDSDQLAESQLTGSYLLLSLDVTSFEWYFPEFDPLRDYLELGAECRLDEFLKSGALVAKETFDESKDQQKKEDLQDPTLELEFPSLEQFMELEMNFVILSRWKFYDGREFMLREVMLSSEQHPEPIVRLEVVQVAPQKNATEYLLHINYQDDKMYQVNSLDLKCYAREAPDVWLDLYASPNVYGHAKLPGQQLKQYGLMGLWKLAGDSHYIEYSKMVVEDKVAIWRLVGNPELPNIVVEFQFDLLDLRHPRMQHRVKLKSVAIDFIFSQNDLVNPSKRTRIDQIQVWAGHAVTNNFDLPATCFSKTTPINPEYWYVFRYAPYVSGEIASPGEAEFQISYELTLNDGLGQTSQTFQVTETRKNSVTRTKITGKQQAQSLWTVGSEQLETIFEQGLTGRCKQVSSVIDFLQVRNYFKYFRGNMDFLGSSRAQLSGALVADLWFLFGNEAKKQSRSGIALQTRYKRCKGGYVRIAEWKLSDGVVWISLFFVEGPKLESIVLRSNSKKTQPVQLYISAIETSLAVPKDTASISQECLNEARDFPSLGSSLNNKPQLGQRVHLKSQETRTLNDGKKLASFRVHDEWLDLSAAGLDKSYRIVTRQPHQAEGRIRDNKDLTIRDHLFLQSTQEFFDLSKPFACQSDIATGNPQGGHEWIVERQLATDLSELSPLILWLTAEQKGIAKWQSLTGPSNEFTILQALDWVATSGWLKRRSWTVELAEDTQVELQFSQEQKGATRWVSLERVLLNGGVNGGRYEFDVINYEQVRADDDEHFRIPKGYGCKRHGLSENHQDDFVQLFDPGEPFELNYEASFVDLAAARTAAAADNNNTDRVLSNYGWFAMCPQSVAVNEPRWKTKASYVFHRENRFFASGQHQSRKMTYTGIRYECLMRELDQKSGKCKLERRYLPHPTNIMSLDFSSPDDHAADIKPIYLSYELLNSIATMKKDSTEHFELIWSSAASEANGWLEERVYERSSASIWLGLGIQGSGSIVVTLRRWHPHSASSQPDQRPHVKIELFLPELAKLTLRFDSIRRRGSCLELLRENEPEQCYESDEFALAANKFAPPKPRLRSYLLEYSTVTQKQMNWLNFERLKSLIEEQFLEQLLADPLGLHPMQLGNVRATFDERSQRMQMEFNLIDRPSAMERYLLSEGQFFQDPSRSERFVHSIEACSLLCDATENCNVMSYCRDEKRCSISRKQASAANYIPRAGCTTYWHQQSVEQPFKSLDRVSEDLAERVDSAQDRSLDITLRTGSKFRAPPFEFRALSFSEQTSDLVLVAESDSHPDSDDEAYVILRENRVLRRSENVHAETRAQCLRLCASRKLLLCSFCQDTGTCWLPQLSNSNESTWVRYKEMLDSSETKDECLIWSVDFESEFLRFDGTRTPKSQMSKLDKVSAQECAAICRLNSTRDQDCLSFDYCSTTTTEASTCHLQSTHLVMDHFDESIMEMGDDSANDTGETCTHYSRHLEADYRRLADSHFMRKELGRVMGGASFETCAILCRRTADATCVAFEYCALKRKCYIRLEERHEESDDLFELAKKVEPMSGCSIYVPVHFDEEQLNSLEKSNDSDDKARASTGNLKYNSLRSAGLVVAGCWLVAALVSGLITQICWLTLSAMMSVRAAR